MPGQDNPTPQETAAIAQRIGTLTDSGAGTADRLKAFFDLKAEAISGAVFDAHRADFLQALRTVATDADAWVRRVALATLAAAGDAYGQGLLIQGLQNSATALVAPILALQFLSRDVHAPVLPVASNIVANSGDPALRAEAAYLLGADASSALTLAALLADKTEATEVRRASAVGLASLDPVAFESIARAIAADSTDGAEIRSVSRTGLSLLRDRQTGSSTA